MGTKRKMETKEIIRILLMVCIGVALMGCSKDDGPVAPNPDPITNEPETTPDPIPTLSSISPENGPKTTIVTINGTHFGTDANAVQVFFNDVDAQIQSVNDTQIKTLVPAKAYTGVVKVTVNGTTLIGPTFTYIITDIQVNTFAGSGQGFMDGTGANAQFYIPYGVAVDKEGNVYVADRGNHKIRKITPDGVVSTLAGSTPGFVDGTGISAKFDIPYGVAVDAEGNVYVADYKNHKIRKITPNGVVSTLAGSTNGFADGTGTIAQFSFPWGVAVDTNGNVYAVDTGNQKIRKITPNGVVSTLAGSTNGFADGLGENAQFSFPHGVAVDGEGNVYVADSNNSKIRKITPDGMVSTLAGSTYGYADGSGMNAQFDNPNGVAVDTEGNVYVADGLNHKIRKIGPGGSVSTLAGNTQGFGEGIGASAQFDLPYGVAVGTRGNIYVADGSNHKIRKITQE